MARALAPEAFRLRHERRRQKPFGIRHIAYISGAAADMLTASGFGPGVVAHPAFRAVGLWGTTGRSIDMREHGLIQARDIPETIDSLSRPEPIALIGALMGQNRLLSEQNAALQAREAELEARLAQPPRTPGNWQRQPCASCPRCGRHPSLPGTRPLHVSRALPAGHGCSALRGPSPIGSPRAAAPPSRPAS